MSIERGYLIWDYERGEVIDASTGEVVDRIFYYGPPRPRAEEEKPRRPRYSGGRRDWVRYRLYRRGLELETRGYLVDYDKLFRQRRFIRTIYSELDLEVIRRLKRKLGYRFRVVDRIVKLLEEDGFIVSGLTIRWRYILAYMVYAEIFHIPYVRATIRDLMGDLVGSINVQYERMRKRLDIIKRNGLFSKIRQDLMHKWGDH